MKSKRFSNNEQATEDLQVLTRRARAILGNCKRNPAEERVHNSIKRAWIRVIKELIDHLKSLARQGQTGTVNAEDKELRRLLKKVNELGVYVEPDASIEERDEGVEHLMNFLFSRGVSWNRLRAIESQLKSRGSPASQRRLAMEVLGFKVTSPQLTFKELAKRCCQCDKKTHDFHCQDSIRKNVGKLRKFLKHHGIPTE